MKGETSESGYFEKKSSEVALLTTRTFFVEKDGTWNKMNVALKVRFSGLATCWRRTSKRILMFPLSVSVLLFDAVSSNPGLVKLLAALQLTGVLDLCVSLDDQNH